MANEGLSELGRRLPHIVLAALAARQGGFPALGAFQGGMQQAQEAQQAQQRQAQLDEERRQLQETQEARAQSAEQRAIQSADLQRRQALLTSMLNFDDGDPSALASFYGVPAEQATPLVAPIVTAREKRKAREFVERIPKDERYKGYFESPEGISQLDETTVLFQGKQVKIRDIRAMAEEVAVPPRPAQAKPDVPNTPEEQFYATFAAEHQTTWDKLPRALKAQARREWMQADDRPTQGPQPTYSWAIDPTTGKAVRATDQEIRDRGLQQPDTAFIRNMAAGKSRATPLLESVVELSKRINVNQGLYAKLAGGAAKIAAKANLDDDVAEYQAMVTAFTPLWARALGHVGILTQVDVDSAREALPKPGDSESLMKRKIARIEKILGAEIPGSEASTQSDSVPAGPAGSDPLGIR